MLTELYRPAEKAAAIQRLMQQTNPLTGKPHSASSPEAVVETAQNYWAFREPPTSLRPCTVRPHGDALRETARDRARFAHNGRSRVWVGFPPSLRAAIE
jgi:hypothetical protein